MYLGEGMDSPPIELDPSIAQLQAQQQGVSVALQVGLPATGFVDSINGLSGPITIQAGTSSTGVTVTVSSDGISVLAIGVTGITAPGVAKSNIALIPPTPSDDESLGYQPFSLWLNTAVPEIYMCASNATLAAVWLKISP